MPFRHSFYGFWAALLLFFGLLAPAAAQRGGDEGAYQILSARYGTSERYVDVTERVRELASGDQPFLVHNDTFGTDPDQLTATLRGRRGQQPEAQQQRGPEAVKRVAKWHGEPP